MTMRHRRSSALVTVFAVAAIWTIAPTTAGAQGAPPAQGPPPASENTGFLVDWFITPDLEQTVDQKVAEKNLDLASASDYRASIAVSYRRWSPVMVQTAYTDRPNERYAKVTYMITYKVSGIKAKIGGVWVPYPWDRTITQTVDIGIFCRGWHTGTGALMMRAQPSPAYLSGDRSFSEQAFAFFLTSALPNHVDSKIRAALDSYAASSSVTDKPCNALGRYANLENPQFDMIYYDFNPPPFNMPHAVSVLSEVSVRVAQVRRLQERTFKGEVVYNAVETPTLELWAGHSLLVVPLPPMAENQVFTPTANNVVSTPRPPVNKQLVVIGSMHDGLSQVDSTFLVFDKSTEFGHGTRVLTTPKHWWEWDQLRSKPIQIRGKGYEVTLEISSMPVLAPTKGTGSALKTPLFEATAEPAPAADPGLTRPRPATGATPLR